jgi:excisionase family DNA binding protein
VTTEPLLTARQVAEYLGVSPGTVLDWFETAKLPGFKVERVVRLRASELEAWLEHRRRGPGTPGGCGPNGNPNEPRTPLQRFGKKTLQTGLLSHCTFGGDFSDTPEKLAR